jgi:hypothetical protein
MSPEDVGMILTEEQLAAKWNSLFENISHHERAVLESPVLKEILDSHAALTDALAQAAGTWTTEKPTMPGWYWWSPTSNPKRPEVVRVTVLENISMAFAEQAGILSPMPVEDMNGEWWGPLASPMTPATKEPT